MDYAQVFSISAAGMAAERTRIEVAALNLANANTVQDGGSAYVPLHVVSRAIALPGAFGQQVDAALGAPDLASLGVPEVVVEPSGVAPRSVYEPGSPVANSSGFVTYPGVETATEMVTLMSAMRAYEANVAAMNTARSLALRTLDIGGGA